MTKERHRILKGQLGAILEHCEKQGKATADAVAELTALQKSAEAKAFNRSLEPLDVSMDVAEATTIASKRASTDAFSLSNSAMHQLWTAAMAEKHSMAVIRALYTPLPGGECV